MYCGFKHRTEKIIDGDLFVLEFTGGPFYCKWGSIGRPSQ